LPRTTSVATFVLQRVREHFALFERVNAAEHSNKIQKQKSAGSAFKENRALKVGRFVFVSLN
jgi:hypothetical protein